MKNVKSFFNTPIGISIVIVIIILLFNMIKLLFISKLGLKFEELQELKIKKQKCLDGLSFEDTKKAFEGIKFCDKNDEKILQLKKEVNEGSQQPYELILENKKESNKNNDNIIIKYDITKDNIKESDIKEIDTYLNELLPKVKEKQISKSNIKNKKVIHNGFSEESDVQNMINYAYEKGGIDLVTLIECENGDWNPFKKANGKEDSWGLCQVNRRWHKDKVDSKDFWISWESQIDICNDLLKGGTKFYGPNRILSNGKKCAHNAHKKFTIV